MWRDTYAYYKTGISVVESHNVPRMYLQYLKELKKVFIKLSILFYFNLQFNIPEILKNNLSYLVSCYQYF